MNPAPFDKVNRDKSLNTKRDIPRPNKWCGVNYHLLKTIILTIVFIQVNYANQTKPIVISPFVDFSYDVSTNNWYYPSYYDYDHYTHDGSNLSFGLNIYRKPLYLQLQLANYLNYLRNDGDAYGIVKVGMNEEMYKNSFFDMNFSYTDNLSQYIHYSAYSGSVGYYHLFMPIDTLASAYFSFGVNLGFVNHTYWERYSVDPGLYPYYYSTNYTEMFTIAEFAWINKYLRPYIAFGIQNITNSDYYFSPRNSGFFSIGIQAHLENVFPYFSGNQTKMTYYKHDDYYPIYVEKPNIYLYPESTTQVKVTLVPKNSNDIIQSIPSYQKGWDISIQPSGKIDNKYEYLFYEGKLAKYPKSEIGWSIPASVLWQFLPQKMAEFGFNEKEIKDFVDYWQTHLPKSEFYKIVPIVNHEIDKEFALKIEPLPQSILRVWFYINPVEKQSNLNPPLITNFERKGFTVVEWGVLLKK